jgi:hypothetical protein
MIAVSFVGDGIYTMQEQQMFNQIGICAMTKIDNIPVNDTNMKDKANALYELETTDRERWESIKQEYVNSNFEFYYVVWPWISYALLIAGIIFVIMRIVLMVLDKKRRRKEVNT